MNESALWIVGIAALVPVTACLLYVTWQAARRRRVFARKFPRAWRDVLQSNVPLYRCLPAKLQAQLCGHINVFLHEKIFEGCAGLTITDEIRVTVAAFACMLLLNRKARYYPALKTIYIYPAEYVAQHTSRDGFLDTVESQARHGESWYRGPIVLSWDSVLRGARDIKDGHNVVLHEFAHKLDEQDGALDGSPLLSQRSHYVTWARVMQTEFKALQNATRKRNKSVMDQYGATEPAEFFAVLTETFYEKPKQLQRTHPELYEEAKRYFKVDPAMWRRA